MVKMSVTLKDPKFISQDEQDKIFKEAIKVAKNNGLSKIKGLEIKHTDDTFRVQFSDKPTGYNCVMTITKVASCRGFNTIRAIELGVWGHGTCSGTERITARSLKHLQDFVITAVSKFATSIRVTKEDAKVEMKNRREFKKLKTSIGFRTRKRKHSDYYADDFVGNHKVTLGQNTNQSYNFEAFEISHNQVVAIAKILRAKK